MLQTRQMFSAANLQQEQPLGTARTIKTVDNKNTLVSDIQQEQQDTNFDRWFLLLGDSENKLTTRTNQCLTKSENGKTSIWQRTRRRLVADLWGYLKTKQRLVADFWGYFGSKNKQSTWWTSNSTLVSDKEQDRRWLLTFEGTLAARTNSLHGEKACNRGVVHNKKHTHQGKEGCKLPLNASHAYPMTVWHLSWRYIFYFDWASSVGKGNIDLLNYYSTKLFHLTPCCGCNCMSFLQHMSCVWSCIYVNETQAIIKIFN